jgi:hypothetical protein
MVLADRGCEVVRGGGGEMFFLDWVGLEGRWASRGSEREGGGALGINHSGRTLGRSSTSA